MTKSELILRIGELNPHLYHRDVERIVTTIFEDHQCPGQARPVELRGFGAFRSKGRDAARSEPGPAKPSRSTKVVPFFKTGKGFARSPQRPPGTRGDPSKAGASTGLEAGGTGNRRCLSRSGWLSARLSLGR